MIKPILESQELIKAINQSDLIKSYCNIPKEWKDIVKISKNSVHRQVGDGKFDARFYSTLKFKDKVTTNMVLAMEKEGVFKHLEKRFGEQILESYYLQSEFKPKLVKYASGSFYPDQDPESTSCDGYITNSVASETWTQIHAGNGTSVDDSDTALQIRVVASTTTDEYSYIDKTKTLFDTSSIGVSNYVSSASFNFTPLFADQDDFGISLSLFEVTTASNTSLSVNDYNNVSWGSTKLASDIAMAAMSNDTESSMTLNTDGKAAINVSGITKFGCTFYDEPTWGNSSDSRLILYSAENGTEQPRLDVTYFEITGYANLLLMGVG